MRALDVLYFFIFLSFFIAILFPWWIWEGEFHLPGYLPGKRRDSIHPWGIMVEIGDSRAYQIFFFRGNNFGNDLLMEALLLPYSHQLSWSLQFSFFAVFVMLLLSLILIILGSRKRSISHIGVATFLLILAPITFFIAWMDRGGYFFLGFYSSFILSFLGLINIKFIQLVHAFFDKSRRLFEAAKTDYMRGEYSNAREKFQEAADFAFKAGDNRFGLSALENALDCCKVTGEELELELKQKLAHACRFR